MKKQFDIKKLVLLNLPYLLMGLFATNFGEAWRLAQGANASEKFLSLFAVLPGALQSFWPSLHPLDLLVGLCCGAGLRLAVYLKSKNAKKYRHGMEYGSARWGTREDMTLHLPQNTALQKNCLIIGRMNGRLKMMRYKLVIAEKPSVAQSLAAVIGATARKDGYLEGNGWRVSWCVGHLAGLADADSYDPKYAKWRYDDLPILPEHWQMVVGKDKKKQFDILKKLMNTPDVTEVVNACDAGREGELIFRSVYELAGCQKPMKRLWISSMEDSAIREGFANLRPGVDYDGLRKAALCRAKADWLVGINATRLFSVLYHRTLNIGRVMSPTLALIVQREAEIDTFKPVPFYTVALELPGLTVSGERISDRASAEQLKEACQDAAVTIKKVECKEKSEKPPALYDLTTLQRDANRLLGFTAQQTLDYLQSLYEKKLCTYPRTDSRYLTGDMADSLPVLVNLVANAISYAVCKYFGIETGENSFGYIASWSQGKELKELRTSLETINKTSGTLISDIERHYKEICKERGIDPLAKAEPETAPIEQPADAIKVSDRLPTGDLTYYVAECMEFPNLGEYHDNLSLEEAVRIYQEIPAERMNGIKGIGFELKDGSDYEGPLEQQARSGQPISLMDLAEAVHREERDKKKSVMEQLKSQPKAEHKKIAPKKSAEREI